MNKNNDDDDHNNSTFHMTIRKRKRQRQRQRRKRYYYYYIIDDKRIATLILLWALTTTTSSSSSSSQLLPPSLSPIPLDDASSRYHPPLPSAYINDVNSNESSNNDDESSSEEEEDGEHMMASPSESEMAAFVGIPTLSTEEEREREERMTEEDEEEEEWIPPPPPPIDEKCNDESSTTTTTTTIKNNHDDDATITTTTTTTTSPQSKIQNDEFLSWCRETLGIESLVTIDYFDYNEKESLPPPLVEEEEEEGRVVKVRGLAAVGYINVGDVLISVPRSSLINTHIIPTNDPFFTSTLQSTPHLNIDEFTTLVLYLLRQRSLHNNKHNYKSHMAPYLDSLQSAPTDTIPMLWTHDRLTRTYPDPEDGVRVATEEIVRDVKELYDEVMPRLIRHAPEVFASPSGEEDDDGWMYSLKNFKWAYAMVNSRHWHLRLGHHDDDRDDNTQETEEEEETLFMVPLADLINFGPPCTKGRYNSQTRSFEIIATCPFVPHQEVTFWYTDHCRDIILAHYGFTHPSIPPCRNTHTLTTLEDWKASSIEWQQKAERYESMLRETQEMMASLENVLNDCFSIKENEDVEDDDDGGYYRGGGTLRGDPTPMQQQQQQVQKQPVDVRVRGRSGAGGGGVRRPSLGRDRGSGSGGGGGGSLNDVGL